MAKTDLAAIQNSGKYDPYEALANQIIVQTVQDYQSAIKELIKARKPTPEMKANDPIRVLYKSKLGRVKYFEDWFNSQAFSALTNLDAKSIILGVRKMEGLS